MTTQKGKKVLISIKKECEINIEERRKDPLIKTYSYSYNARYADGRNLIRYCSPDRDFGHRAQYHKHAYYNL